MTCIYVFLFEVINYVKDALNSTCAIYSLYLWLLCLSCGGILKKVWKMKQSIIKKSACEGNSNNRTHVVNRVWY